MNKDEFARFTKAYFDAFDTLLNEARKVDLKKFPRVRIVFEFEAPNKSAIEVRKRRPWQ